MWKGNRLSQPTVGRYDVREYEKYTIITIHLNQLSDFLDIFLQFFFVENRLII
jgi:hypothetical protein